MDGAEQLNSNQRKRKRRRERQKEAKSKREALEKAKGRNLKQLEGEELIKLSRAALHEARKKLNPAVSQKRKTESKRATPKKKSRSATPPKSPGSSSYVSSSGESSPKPVKLD